MDVKKLSIYERITNIILDVLICIFGVILLITIYNGIQVKILGNAYSSFFGYSIFEVQTGSMADEINAGDWIIVKSSDKVELNDIITFEQNGEFITHRVVEAYKGTYITKGDANNAKDDPINQDQIVGKVSKILPHFGIFRKTVFNPGVLITLIITVYACSFVFRKSNKEKETNNFRDETTKKIDELLESLIEAVKNRINNAKDNAKNNAKKEKVVQTIKIEEEKPKAKPEEKEKKEEEVKYEKVEPVKEEEEYKTTEIKLEPINEEDLDKTMYFRSVKVDRDELDSTFLEISKNQQKEEEKEQKEKERLELKKEKELAKAKAKQEAENIDDSIIESSLEMLQSKNNRKFKNIIDKIMYLKENELIEIIEVLNNEEKLLVNEATIRNNFIKNYIDVKYYNFCGDKNAEYNGRNMTVKIVDAIKEASEQMIYEYKGTDSKYAEKVKKYTNIFILIMYLEQANGQIDDIEPIREMYKKKITRYSKNISDKDVKTMIDKIIKIQRIYHGMIKYSLKKLETNTFELQYTQLSSKKQLYALDLEHNITFSKVYSEYIVDKTYSEGVIAEDKVMIVISLLSTQLVKDMLNSDFRKKYIIYVPESLYTKENKLSKLTKMLEDEYAKNNVMWLIKYVDLIRNKKIIKDLRKSGYKFALVFDKDVEIKAKDQSSMCLAEYIFIDKKTVDAAKILPLVPEDMKNNILYENIGSKVGNYGGE